MATFMMAMLAYVRAFLAARHDVAMETAALRQQLAVYKRRALRPKLNRCDRLFWVLVRHVWINWSEALVLVKPDTVVSVALRRLPTVLEMAISPAAESDAQRSHRKSDS